MRLRDQRGLALIMVLWSMVVLALVAGAVLHRSSGDSRLARNMEAGAGAELAADAAVRLAIAGLAAGAPWGWPADGETGRLRVAGAEVALTIEDEAGRLDLNAAPPALIAALIETLGRPPDEAAALADAIADYRDDDGARRPRGAEDPDYAAAGLALGAADAPFAAPEEVGRVFGVGDGLRRALLPHVTTWSGMPEPGRGGASAAVLAALARRDEAAAEAGIAPAQSRLLLLPTGAEPRRQRMVARITAVARTPAGATFARRAVVEIPSAETPPFRILDWQHRWGPGD